MSVDHSINLSGDEHYEGRLNVSGLDAAESDASLVHGTFYRYRRDNGSPETTHRFSLEDLRNIHGHLSQYSIVTTQLAERTGKFVEVEPGQEELLGLMMSANTESVIEVVRHLVEKRFSRDDTNAILGRKAALVVFEELLSGGKRPEAEWQKFFEDNEWIFGYGLRYRFLKILQREAHVSTTDLGGGDSAISDFLVADHAFTKLIELKRPDTPIFGTRKNRSGAWSLSAELMDAVSQILAQKASWELEGTKQQFTRAGDRIEQGVADVDCILVFGDSSKIDGTDQERGIKSRTFELFRRNLRNVEVVTYNELLARASYIVRGAEHAV